MVVGSFALIFVGVVVAGVKYLIPGVTAYMNYRSRFKHEVAAEVFKIVCPTAAYCAAEGVPAQIFDEPGLFNTRGGYNSDDRVRGTIGATPFEAADVSRSYSTGGKNSRTVIVFRGLFFHLDFNKTLHRHHHRAAGRRVVQLDRRPLGTDARCSSRIRRSPQHSPSTPATRSRRATS